MAEAGFFDKIEKIKMPVRLVIYAGTLVLLAGLFVWQVYLPKTEEIDKTKKEIASLEQKLRKVKIRAKRKKAFEAKLAQVDAQLKEALKLLPNKKEIPKLLTKVTQLGTDSRLQFRYFNPQKERAKDFYLEIPVSIEVSGNYHDVAIFFNKVGRMDRIVNILNVRMKPDGSRSTNLITNCDAVTYRFKGGSDDDKAK